jgi:hypothetical protein
LRLFIIGATTLAALVTLGAWFDLLEVFSAIDASGIRQAVEQQESLFFNLYAEEAQSFAAALTASLEARQSGLGDMRGLRMLALFGLSVSATSLFMSGWRLLWMEPLSRPRISRALSKTALACALFRTLDGAQSAALARRAGAAFDMSAAFKAHLPQSMETTLTFFSAALTFFVVALFFWAWRYFQAAHVLALLEKPLPPP